MAVTAPPDFLSVALSSKLIGSCRRWKSFKISHRCTVSFHYVCVCACVRACVRACMCVCDQGVEDQHPGQPAVSYGAVRQQPGGARGGTDTSLSWRETQGWGSAVPDTTTVSTAYTTAVPDTIRVSTAFSNLIGIPPPARPQLSGGAAEAWWDGSGWSLRLRHHLLQWHRGFHCALCREHTDGGELTWFTSQTLCRILFVTKLELNSQWHWRPSCCKVKRSRWSSLNLSCCWLKHFGMPCVTAGVSLWRSLFRCRSELLILLFPLCRWWLCWTTSTPASMPSLTTLMFTRWQVQHKLFWFIVLSVKFHLNRIQ